MPETPSGPTIPPPPPPNAVGFAFAPPASIPGTEPGVPAQAEVYDTGTQTPPGVPAPGEQPVRRRRRTREQMEADRQQLARQQTEPPPHPNGSTPPIAITLPMEDNGQVEYVGEVPKFWASVGATINIGNYESFKLDMGMSGIPYDASSEDIEEIFTRADVGIHETVEVLMNKVIDRAREIKIARGLLPEE